jgi:hypothetical protein
MRPRAAFQRSSKSRSHKTLEIHADHRRSIVFVHGLNVSNQKNHAMMSWTHQNGILWPRDLLPQDVPNARILVFGYNSNIMRNVSQEGIQDHATNLLDRLGRNRNATEVCGSHVSPGKKKC